LNAKAAAMFAPLEHWHEFYILLGTAAAALVALLFVAASVGTGFLSFEKAAASRVYMTPIIVHFSAVLFASAVALVPSHTAVTFALCLGLSSAVGVIYYGFLSTKILREGGNHVEFDDKLFHGVAPPISYALGVASAIMFYRGSEHAATALAVALLLLLAANIRNAWDLTLFLVRQHTAQHPPDERS
jgi:hypothetical protein